MSWADLGNSAPAPRESEPVRKVVPLTGSREQKYAARALNDECAGVEQAREGERNDTLNRAAFSLGQLVASGVLAEAEVWSGLQAAAARCGLGRHEADATIASGLRAGKEQPRGLPAADERAAERNSPAPPEDDYEHTDADAPDVSPSERAPEAMERQSKPMTPAGILNRWREEGPLVRVPTGIVALDEACRGGLPIPWRVFCVGAPSAGKTFMQVSIADQLARAAAASGLLVGILAVDEDPEDITMRLAQIAGFTVAQAELRDPELLAEMADALGPLRLRLYDSTHSIDSAAADLAGWCATEGRRGALFVDSIQAARSDAAAMAETPRQVVESNVVAIRCASTSHRLLVVATSEANRASYRTEEASQASNDLAAGAESRAIEFGAQTQLMLRTPKDHPDVIHVRIAKNRRAHVGEFWLRLDRDRHTLTPCQDPCADPATAAARTEERRASVRANVLRDAEELAALLVRNPGGLGKRELRAALKAAGHKWGVERLDAARLVLAEGHKGVRLEEALDGKRNVSRLQPDTSDTEER